MTAVMPATTKTATKTNRIIITKAVTAATAPTVHRQGHARMVLRVAIANNSSRGRDRMGHKAIITASNISKAATAPTAAIARRETGMVTASKAQGLMVHRPALNKKEATARKEVVTTGAIITAQGLIIPTETITRHRQGPNNESF